MNNSGLVNSFVRAIVFAAILVVMLWLLQRTYPMLLVFLLAIVLVLVINAPVAWLEKKNIKRSWASLIVFGIILIVLSLLSWLVIPRVYQQMREVIANIPIYVKRLTSQLSALLEDYPELVEEIQEESYMITQLMPSVSELLRRVGNYSITVFGFVFIFILFTCIIVYAVVRPRPLLQLYFQFFPLDKQDKAQAALSHTSTMLGGWIRANLIGGGIEAVCTTTFLSMMNVPGAWIWGAIALFAEMIPNLGFYIMAIPPTLIAFSVGPYTAMWVFIFFLILSEIMASFVMPKLISSTMNIHPVCTLFMLLVMGSAFGLIGAFLTVPVTAIIKAYYEEFWGNKENENLSTEKRIDKVLY